MTQNNILNIKISNWQLKKIKSGIKDGTQLALNLSSSVTHDFNNETSFLHKLLLTDRQVSMLVRERVHWEQMV